MEDVNSLANLKSAITFVHLAGLALGIGCAWTLDLFIFKHFKKHTITEEKYDVIAFVSRLVTVGLVVLWISGGLFILYYYHFTPEFLGNEKVWGKLFIVSVLTVNGLLVHRMLLPKLRNAIGSNLLETLTQKELRLVVSVGTISFLSWMVPMILGVSKTLNFTVPGVYIVGVYLYVLALSLILSDMAAMLIHRLFRNRDISPSHMNARLVTR